jgi:glutathione S-transferase
MAAMTGNGEGLVLYHMTATRSAIVLWMLEELGQPYRLTVLDKAKGENREPPFLAINPMGKVPTLVHDGQVITESGAICCYLADAFPAAGLSVPIGDRRRGAYLKWLFFMHSCLEPALMDRMLSRPAVPRQMSGYGDFETLLAVLAAGLRPGPFLMGEQFTAADVVIGSSLGWGRMIGAIPDEPAILAYLARLEERPARRRFMAKEQALTAAEGAP